MKTREDEIVWVTWTFFGGSGEAPEANCVHAVIPDQLGTSQEAMCGLSPGVGSVWCELEGPSCLPVCISCSRELAWRPRRKPKVNRLKVIQGGKRGRR